MRRMPFFIMLLFIFCMLLIPSPAIGNQKVVYVVPVEETVEKGLYAFLKRAITTAEKEHADAVIFELNTPGGAVDAATEIGKLFTSSDVETIAFVNKKALSAGA